MNGPPRFNFSGLVVRTLKSRPYRNLAVAAAFAIIAATLFSAQYLASGAKESLDRGNGWLGADLIVVPGDPGAPGEESILGGRPSMFFFNDTGAGSISRIPGVARVSPQILIASLPGQSCCSGYVQLIAIDPESDFSLGRWLDTEYGMPLGRDGIILGSMVEGDSGSDLRFYGHDFHIVNRLNPTGMRGIDSSVFIRMEDAVVMASESGTKAKEPLILPRGMASRVLVRLDPGTTSADVADAILRQMPGTRIITPASLSVAVARHLSGITLLLQYAAVIVTAITLPALLAVSVLFAREVNEEVTLLGALGVTRSFVLRLVLAESFAASIAGVFAGIGVAAVLLVAFQNLIVFALEIPFSVPSVQALALAAGSTLLITGMLGCLASIYPTLRILRSEAYRAIQS